jgi:hypothetical protein
MIETSYTKLFSSIVTSTIWREDDKTRIVWITMLALKNRHGQVNGSVPGLAAMANVGLEDCRAALIKLAAPDIDSRTKEFEGRRIAVIDGGWQILNFAKYRNAMSEDERREYQRLWQQNKRKSKRVDKSVDVSKSTLTQADTETETEVDTEALVPPEIEFFEWERRTARMYHRELKELKSDLKSKLSRARSESAKAEWIRRLKVVECRLIGPDVPDTTPEPTLEPPKTPVDPVLAANQIAELKATVAATEPIRPKPAVLREVRFKRPKPPTPKPNLGTV